MSALAIQAYLRAGGTFEDLLSRYAIKAKRHPAHPELVLLKYDQIASPFGEPIVRECRGIILDSSDDWRVVSRAFDKFFNHGEWHAAEIDWATARVLEKLDGSLCVLYAHAGQWHVATSGTPDASGDVHRGGVSFRDLFWRAVGDRRDSLPPPAGSACFSFELTSPLNRIVVRHTEVALTLLAGRWLRHAGQPEMPLEQAAAVVGGRFPMVASHALASFGALDASHDARSPLSHEGYVVVDASFRRVKVKSPAYVALHHAKDGLTVRGFVEIARSGETSEVETAFPEFAPELNEARRRVTALAEEIDGDFARLRDIPVQKDFALEALKTRSSAALFLLRSRKVESAREYLRGEHLDQLVEVLGYHRDTASEAAP